MRNDTLFFLDVAVFGYLCYVFCNVTITSLHVVWRKKSKEAQLGSLNQTISWMCDSKIPVDELDHDSGMLDDVM